MYKSITYGHLTEQQVFDKIVAELLSKEHEYEISVGTDSQVYDQTKVATAIVLRRIGKGAIYFVHVTEAPRFHTLRDRMWHEANTSLAVAKRLTEHFYSWDLDYRPPVHLDLGKKGLSKIVINEITGYITAEGFDCVIKPYASTASVVADRYSK